MHGGLMHLAGYESYNNVNNDNQGLYNQINYFKEQYRIAEQGKTLALNALKVLEKEKEDALNKVNELEKQIEEMKYYSLNGPGYQQAKEHFEELVIEQEGQQELEEKPEIEIVSSVIYMFMSHIWQGMT